MMTWLAVAALLLTQALNGAPSADYWERYQFQRDLNECVVTALAEKAKNGGLEMDRTGHGAEADRVLEECRKVLGETQGK